MDPGYVLELAMQRAIILPGYVLELGTQHSP
jgi:hypothetical protein